MPAVPSPAGPALPAGPLPPGPGDLLAAILEALDIPFPATVGDSRRYREVLADRAAHARVTLKAVLTLPPGQVDLGWEAGWLRRKLAESPPTGYQHWRDTPAVPPEVPPEVPPGVPQDNGTAPPPVPDAWAPCAGHPPCATAGPVGCSDHWPPPEVPPAGTSPDDERTTA